MYMIENSKKEMSSQSFIEQQHHDINGRTKNLQMGKNVHKIEPVSVSKQLDKQNKISPAI